MKPKREKPLSKMLLADVQGVQKVLGITTEEVIFSMEDLLKNRNKYDIGCPLGKLTYGREEELSKPARKEGRFEYYFTDETYIFQPFGRRGATWWFRLNAIEQRKQIHLLIKYLRKEIS